MRRLGWRVLLAGVISLGLAASARAGTSPDRSDLLDIANGMVADKLNSPVTLNRAFLHLGEGNNGGVQGASGTIENSASGGTFLHWRAFEPDQTKRSSTGGSLQQLDQLAIRIVIKGAEVVPLQVVAGCKAKVSAKAPKGATSSTEVDKGEWSMSCDGRRAETKPTLTEQNLADLRNALGTKVWGKNSVDVEGKCTGTNCAVLP